MKLDDVVYLLVEEVIDLHDAQLARYGGLSGVKDRGLLESAVMAPQTGYYGSLAELAAVYAHAIAMNHAFNDANKRTAAAAALTFLEMNGYPVPPFDEQIVVDLVTGAMTRDEFATFIAEAMGGDESIA